MKNKQTPDWLDWVARGPGTKLVRAPCPGPWTPWVTRAPWPIGSHVPHGTHGPQVIHGTRVTRGSPEPHGPTRWGWGVPHTRPERTNYTLIGHTIIPKTVLSPGLCDPQPTRNEVMG